MRERVWQNMIEEMLLGNVIENDFSSRRYSTEYFGYLSIGEENFLVTISNEIIEKQKMYFFLVSDAG